MTIAPASTSWPAVAPVERDPAGRRDARRALEPIDLVLAEQELDAAGQGRRRPCPCAPSSRARSSPTSPTLIPCSARACRASTNFSEDCSSAFDGMQPILRQVPPRRRARCRRRPCACRAAPPGSPRHTRPARRRSRRCRSARALPSSNSQSRRKPGPTRPKTEWLRDGPRLSPGSRRRTGMAYGHVVTGRTAAATGPRRIP